MWTVSYGGVLGFLELKSNCSDLEAFYLHRDKQNVITDKKINRDQGQVTGGKKVEGNHQEVSDTTTEEGAILGPASFFL